MVSKEAAEELIKDWVNKGLVKKGKTTVGLAKVLKVDQPRITEITKGRRRVQAAELPIIAQYLEEPIPEELTVVRDPFTRIKVVGLVQGGYWAEPDEDRAPQDLFIDIPLPEVYRQFQKFGLKVEGSSMNLVYPAGTLLVCVSLYDLHEDEPIAGKKYIVERIKPDGRRETTVKEVQKDVHGKWWLWPRSNDPEHQEPIPFDAVDGDTVQVQARVIFAVMPQ